MDEEQGLASPIAGGIRGIRRSVSSSVFTGRAVAPPAPDPQVTSLLNQNSLTLTTVSSQLSNISEQVRGLNSSLLVIKDNLDLSDQLDRRREQEKAKREAILAEQALREGKESELEKKIQFALLTPVRRVSRFAQGILSRLTNFLLILAGGWLVDKTLSFIRLTSEGNIDKLNEFKRKFLRDLLFLGSIGIGLTIGVGKIVTTIGRLSGLALKLAFSNLIKKPFAAALTFLGRNLLKFRDIVLGQTKNIIKKAPGVVGKVFKPLLSVAPLGLIPFHKQIINFLKNPFGKKAVTEAVEGGAKAGAKKGGLKALGPWGVGLELVLSPLFGFFDYKDRKEAGQTEGQAKAGATADQLGGLAGTLIGLTLLPEPLTSATGIIGLTILSMFGGFSASKITDMITGANRNKENSNKEEETNNEDNVDGKTKTYESPTVSMSLGNDNSNNITPINNKNNVATTISNFEESPQITYLPLGGVTNSQGSVSSGAGSSKTPSDTLPTIPSSDFANNSIALSESIYNVVV